MFRTEYDSDSDVEEMELEITKNYLVLSTINYLIILVSSLLVHTSINIHS